MEVLFNEPKNYTYQDLVEIDDENRYEIYNGELVYKAK